MFGHVVLAYEDTAAQVVVVKYNADDLDKIIGCSDKNIKKMLQIVSPHLKEFREETGLSEEGSEIIDVFALRLFIAGKVFSHEERDNIIRSFQQAEKPNIETTPGLLEIFYHGRFNTNLENLLKASFDLGALAKKED